jgi:GNAT superfamily N-acetyltransferase
MAYSMDIRLALEADAPDISELIYSTSVACCFSLEHPCPKWYEESVRPGQISKLLQSEQMVWVIAIHDQKLMGVLAVSEKNHIKYFFVHPLFQKMGVGKKLWGFALSIKAFGNSLAVRSSIFAVPVYERLGFKAIGPLNFINGIAYQTMVANYSIGAALD